MIDPITADELRAAVCEQMLGVWRQRIDDEAWLRPRAYQAFSVLTFCRALYVLRFGTPVSKPRAAAWAETEYPNWAARIEQALAWRADHNDGDPSDTIAFMREAFAEVRKACEDCGL